MNKNTKVSGLFYSLILFTICSYVKASDLEDLAKEGYTVIDKTYVDGDFEGCDFDKAILLKNSLIFICNTYSYTFSYQPEVLILENLNTGDFKILINGRNFDGKLYRR